MKMTDDRRNILNNYRNGYFAYFAFKQELSVHDLDMIDDPLLLYMLTYVNPDTNTQQGEAPLFDHKSTEIFCAALSLLQAIEEEVHRRRGITKVQIQKSSAHIAAIVGLICCEALAS